VTWSTLHRTRRPVVAGAMVALLILPTAVSAHPFGEWRPAAPETAMNIPGVNDGCPIESPNGRQLFIASNRLGTLGGNDIWVAARKNERAEWSVPVNLGAPINSAANDFCPTPLNGNWLLFVSERPGPATCNAGPGSGDIYIARHDPAHGWTEPRNLGCDADGTGPNFPGGEFGPSLVTTAEGTVLYFSSFAYAADMDIYVSRMRSDGTFGRASRVDELSTIGFADFMPNVGRHGLEIVFNSNRPGGSGGQDVYAATRSRTADPWSVPVNLGPNVNTAGNESRASISGDGQRLHFGRDGDVFVSIRETPTAN
jgi:hypothetical protein